MDKCYSLVTVFSLLPFSFNLTSIYMCVSLMIVCSYLLASSINQSINIEGIQRDASPIVRSAAVEGLAVHTAANLRSLLLAIHDPDLTVRTVL
jgi:uncharacterized membrane protein YfhO